MAKLRRHSSRLLRTVAPLGVMGLLAWGAAELRGEPVLRRPGGPAGPAPVRLTPLRQRLQVKVREARRSPRVVVRESSVRLGLFRGEKVKVVRIQPERELRLNGRRTKKPFIVRLERGKLLLEQGSRRRFVKGPIRIQSGEQRLALRTGRRKLVTAGSLTLQARGSQLLIVNELDLETYLLGTVEAELGSLRLPAAALQAQLIAGRSYVLAARDRHPGRDFAFCDGPHCQVYAGLGHLPKKLRQAGEAVSGLYLRYKGKPAVGFFHHSCGGMTAAGGDVWPGTARPYLRPVADPRPEKLGSIRADWSFSANRGELARLFRARGWLGPWRALNELRVIRRDRSGRAAQILIQSEHPKWVRSGDFRRAVNAHFRREVLPSTLFTIRATGDRVLFEGRGWGHGVGLCQAGAVAMARDGRTARQIVAHYFPGTDLARLPRGGSRRRTTR